MTTRSPSLRRLAAEVRGWIEFGCAERALVKLEPLLASPADRPTGLRLQVHALIALQRPADALAPLRELRRSVASSDWLDLTEAWCRKRTGDLAGAAACMRELVARSPRSALGHFNLGCYLSLGGSTDAALAALAMACRLDPQLRELAWEDADLRAVRDDPRFSAICGRARRRSST